MPPSGEPLTPVEVQILKLIGQRSYRTYSRERKPTNRQIALQLGISLNQVRFHVRKINFKLGTAGETHHAYPAAKILGLL